MAAIIPKETSKKTLYKTESDMRNYVFNRDILKALLSVFLKK